MADHVFATPGWCLGRPVRSGRPRGAGRRKMRSDLGC